MKKIIGCFPVLQPNLNWLLKSVQTDRLMTSVSFINRTEKNRNIHRVFDFDKIIFLDCGIFQKYKKDLDWTTIVSYRTKLTKWYLKLQPSIASSLDIPSLLWHKINEKRKRLRWSLKNYTYMRDELPQETPLFLGISAFSEKSVQIVSRLIKDKIGTVENIALGGQVPLLKAAAKKPDFGKIVVRTVHYVNKAFPNSNIHVYGAGNPRWYMMMRYLGATSADYSGYIKLAGMGRVLVKGSGSRYLNRKIEIKTNDKRTVHVRPKDLVISKEEYVRFLNCECPACTTYSPDELDSSRELRLIHNLSVVNTETKIVDELCRASDFKNLNKLINNHYAKSVLNPIAKYVLKLVRI